MNKTLKLIFIIFIIIIVILTIVVLVATFLTGEKKGTNNNQNSNAVTTNVNQTTNTTPSNANQTTENANAVTNTNQAEQPSDLESSLKSIASNFAERFGSYSNDSDYENVTKLMIYMSESMKSWADQYIQEQQQANPPGSEYYGIITKALSTNTVSLEEGKGTAEFTVSTQRRENSGGEEANVFYQDITIKFVKEKGNWRVNEVHWQEVK